MVHFFFYFLGHMVLCLEKNGMRYEIGFANTKLAIYSLLSEVFFRFPVSVLSATKMRQMKTKRSARCDERYRNF